MKKSGWLSLLVTAGILLGPHRNALSAIFNVDRTDDDATATGCSDAVPNDCSLRGAVIKANNSVAADVINLQAGTYALSIPNGAEGNTADDERGDLDIALLGDVTINGVGSAVTIIDGNEDVTNDRVFHVVSGNVVFNHLTIQNGRPKSWAGGGIENVSDLTLNHCVVRQNTALHGGGISTLNGNLTLNNTVVTQNTTLSGGLGGGIWMDSGSSPGILTLNDSTVSGNTATTSGGGIAVGDSIFLLNRSTVSGNRAESLSGASGSAGAIYIADSDIGGTYTIQNSTISGNAAVNPPGGLFIGATDVTIINSTFSGNEAEGSAGALLVSSSGGAAAIQNTIIADSNGPNCQDSGGDISSQGTNLEDGNTCGFSSASDKTNTPANLGQLQDNGGPTFTHALLVGSQAINGGNAAACTGDLATDQRGETRVGTCDIGSFESSCGDGTRNADEACDDGNTNNDDDCTTTCAPPGCGDLILQTGEECDDGNAEIGDGCDGGCQIEEGGTTGGTGGTTGGTTGGGTAGTTTGTDGEGGCNLIRTDKRTGPPGRLRLG